jgi:hypothetical protein
MEVSQMPNRPDVLTRIKFGRYQIIAGSLGDRFTARGFIGRLLIL